MTTLVVGASGATGRLLVDALLARGETVRAIVRAPEKMPAGMKSAEGLTLIQASLLDLGDAEMAAQMRGCRAVASCLGHNLTLRGIFGPPRRLVTDATRRLCAGIRSNRPDQMTRFVLMNTAGNRNHDLDEPISAGQRLVIGLLRRLLPPQADNEQAADFLRTVVGQRDELIEWAVVRPDSLIDQEQVTPYDVYPSPIRSAVFNPGQTSRTNVADFMAELITNDETWTAWRGQMPVIYNRA